MSHALLAHSERVTHHLCHSPSHQLTLVVDLDERGIFQAHVADGHQKNLFEFSSEDEDGLWLIEFGFMTHGRDTDGLLDYLQSMGIVGASATMTVDG